MEKLDEFAIITFIVCDAILENIYEIKNFYRYYCNSVKNEAKDIFNRLFR